MIKIKEPYMISMKNDPAIRQKLAEANKVLPTTIQSWLRNEDPLLTTAMNMDIIKNHFGLLQGTQILEQEPIGAEK